MAVSQPLRLAAIALIGVGLWLPLDDIFRYPDRLSVLPNLQTDAAAYHQLAVELAESGSWSVLPPRHPPAWVTVLALTYLAVGAPSFVAAKLVLWSSLVALMILGGWLAARVYGPAAGWVAAILIATSPALRGYVGTPQYEVFTGALLLGVLVLAVRTIESAGPTRLREAAWVGLVGGLLVLTRESFAVVMPLVALWLATRLTPVVGRSQAWRAALVVMLLSAAPGVLWSAVQSIRTGGLITISEKGPIVVELGNNPLANGTYNAPLVGIGQPTGMAFVLAEPGRTLVLAGRKVLYFWGVLRDGWNVPRPLAIWLWRTTTGLVPLEVITALARGGWLLLLFIAALVMLGHRGRVTWWGLPATVLIIMAVHIATLSSHRFAVPVLPVVFVLVSGPLVSMLQRASQLTRSTAVRAAVALLVAVGIAMQGQRWPLAVTLHAGALEGLEAGNAVDPESGQPVRVADARRGVRPVVLWPDEYLPRGMVRLDVALRATSPGPDDVAAVRIALVDLDERVACARDVPAGEIRGARMTTVSLTCTLADDGPATLAIYSLGTVDVSAGRIHLQW